MSSGHQAFLMEQQRPDIFQAKIGNIPPGKSVQVKISYVAEISNDDENEKLRFVLPTTIAPRYERPDLAGSPSVNSEMIDNVLGAAYGLTVNVHCEMKGDIMSIESPSHPVKITNLASNKSEITLALKEVHLDKDFVVIVKSSMFDHPRVMVEHDAEHGTNCVMLTFVPRFTLQERLCEFIFVLDRSGSMEGQKIKQVRQALVLFLKLRRFLG